MLTKGMKLIGFVAEPTPDPNDIVLTEKLKAAASIDAIYAAELQKQNTPPFLTAEAKIVFNNAVQEVLNASNAVTKALEFPN